MDRRLELAEHGALSLGRREAEAGISGDEKRGMVERYLCTV